MHAPWREAEIGSRPAARTASPPGSSRRWWPLALLGAAQFMLVIDVTVVNVALPSIGRDLALDRVALTWVATAYTLLFGGLLLVGGRLADTFGRRRMFLTGLGLFTAASMASGLAPAGGVLIVSRAVQGIGAALLSPAALSMITSMFDGPDRGRALSVWAALGGSGAAFGVILGGALASGPGWQWIFFVNVPVGILVALGVTRIVPSFAGRGGFAGIDLPAVFMIAPAIGLLLYGFITAGDSGWASLATLAPIGAAVLLLGSFIWRERTVSAPLVRLELFAERTVSGSLVVLVAASALLAGSFFLNSLFLQRVVGLTPVETGLVFVPVALAIIAGAQAGARLVAHAGSRMAIAGALTIAAVGLALMSRVPAQANVLVDVEPGFVLAAFGIGMTILGAMTTAFTRIRAEDTGLASGLVNTGHELGFALGVAILSTIGGAGLGGGFGVGAFQTAFQAAVVLAVIGAGCAVLLLPADRPRVVGRAFAH